MKPQYAAVLAGMFLLSAPAVHAAPATQAEAQRLAGVFEAYLGKGTGSSISPVAVTPRGEDYIVAVNVEHLVKPLSVFDITLQMQPLAMTLTPRGDGLWQVSQNGFPEFRLRIKEQDMKMQFEGLRFDGLYDAKMMAFKSGRTSHASSTLESTAPNFLNTRRDGPSVVEMSSTEAGPGGVSGIIRSVSQSHTQMFRLTQGAGATEINVTTGQISSDIAIDTYSNTKLMELWAFLVANPSGEALTGKLEDITSMVRSALPIFKSVSQNSTLQTLSISTPLGNFGARELGLGLKLTGVLPQGDFGMRVAMNGLSMPPAILPSWSQVIVPTDFVLDFKANGYDLQAAFEEILKIARPNVDPDESKAAGERAVYALAPDGKVKIALGPSRIESKMLSISMEGELTILKQDPKGRLVIKARGLDETIESLRAAANSDPDAEKVLIGLTTAKLFGEAAPDGSLIWIVENPKGGMPTINGMAIPGGR